MKELQKAQLTIEESCHYMKTADLETMQKMDVRTVSLDELVDLNEVSIDENLSREQRIAAFVRQVRNPYCFKVGKVAVSVGFTQDGVTFGQRMEQYLKTL